MARGAVDLTWDESLRIWTLRFVKHEAISKIPAITGEFTEYQVRKSKNRFLALTYPEWLQLPEALRRVHPAYGEYMEEERQRRASERIPSSPAQRAAREKCLRNDHTWMVANGPLQDVAFTVEERLETKEETDAEPPKELGKPIGTPVGRITCRCYFCSQEVVTRGWNIFLGFGNKPPSGAVHGAGD